MPRPGTLKQLWQLLTIFDLSGNSEAASRTENAISWDDTDPQIVEHEDDDGDYYEEDVDWYTGDCDDELDETAYTVATPTPDFK